MERASVGAGWNILMPVEFSGKHGAGRRFNGGTGWCSIFVCLVLSLVVLVGGRHAAACGAGFGAQLELQPDQIIVVSYHDGQENYVFQPRFCGDSTAFGLILPVANPLTSDPALTDSKLYEQLAAVAAPRTEVVEICGGLLMRAGGNALAINDMGTSGDVAVVSRGKVGIFSWELRKADSTKSFTDWLDAKKFPYPAIAQQAFAHYVEAGWYFVALHQAQN